MKYIECEGAQGVGYCSDNDCPCTVTPINEGTGFLFISPQVVEFRKDALTREEIKLKIAPAIENGEYIPISDYEPILICHKGAKMRNLDLDVAAEDAKMWWGNHRVPLRPTPVFAVENKMEPIDSNTAERNFAHIAYSSETPDQEDNPLGLMMNEKKGMEEKPFSGSELDNLSTDDVVSQYEGTPLAELAAKMAVQEADEKDSAITDTAIPNTAFINNYASFKDNNGVDEDYEEEENIRSQPVKKEKKVKSKTPFMFFAILVLILGFGGIFYFFLDYFDIDLFTKENKMTSYPVKKYNGSTKLSSVNNDEPLSEKVGDKIPEQVKKPQVRLEKPPVQVKKPPIQVGKNMISELPQGFFSANYTFKDNAYHGVISFSNVTASGGTYSQKVYVSGKDKVFNVNGTFSYTRRKVVFTPAGVSFKVEWMLKSFDPKNNIAVFYDPKKGNTREAEVVLVVDN